MWWWLPIVFISAFGSQAHALVSTWDSIGILAKPRCEQDRPVGLRINPDKLFVFTRGEKQFYLRTDALFVVADPVDTTGRASVYLLEAAEMRKTRLGTISISRAACTNPDERLDERLIELQLERGISLALSEMFVDQQPTYDETTRKWRRRTVVTPTFQWWEREQVKGSLGTNVRSAYQISATELPSFHAVVEFRNRVTAWTSAVFRRKKKFETRLGFTPCAEALRDRLGTQ